MLFLPLRSRTGRSVMAIGNSYPLAEDSHRRLRGTYRLLVGWLTRALCWAFVLLMIPPVQDGFAQVKLDPKQAPGKGKVPLPKRQLPPEAKPGEMKAPEPVLPNAPDKLLTLKRTLTHDEIIRVLQSVARRSVPIGGPLPTDVEETITLTPNAPTVANRAALQGFYVHWNPHCSPIYQPDRCSVWITESGILSVYVRTRRDWQPLLIAIDCATNPRGQRVLGRSGGEPAIETIYQSADRRAPLHFAFVARFQGLNEYRFYPVDGRHRLEIYAVSVTLAM